MKRSKKVQIQTRKKMAKPKPGKRKATTKTPTPSPSQKPPTQKTSSHLTTSNSPRVSSPTTAKTPRPHPSTKTNGKASVPSRLPKERLTRNGSEGKERRRLRKNRRKNAASCARYPLSRRMRIMRSLLKESQRIISNYFVIQRFNTRLVAQKG